MKVYFYSSIHATEQQSTAYDLVQEQVLGGASVGCRANWVHALP